MHHITNVLNAGGRIWRDFYNSDVFLRLVVLDVQTGVKCAETAVPYDILVHISD